MKIRIVERLLAALAGLLLALQGVLYALWAFGVIEKAWLPQMGDGLVAKLLTAIVFILLGIFLCGLLFRRSKGRKGFVLQSTENGELSISIKAMESLVQKCVDKHDELKVLSINISNGRDGVVVALKIGLANGISIPLAVNSLQKQIKQYITACSGVDVQEVRVQVETTSASPAGSPYAVAETEIVLEKEPDAPEAEKPAVMPEPFAEAPVEIPEPEEDDRPLHQRLFSHREEEATVPVPPVAEEELPEPETLNETNSNVREENDDETV